MAITRVQGNAKGTSTTNNISVTMASTPTSGNVLIAVIGMNTSSKNVSVTSIIQTGVTWTLQVRSTNGSYLGIEIWLGVVGAGAATGITINLSGNAAYGGVADVCEYSGVAISGYLDKTAINAGTSYQIDTGTTVTTTQADELWIGGGSPAGADTQSSPTNGFTLLDGVYYNYVSVSYLEKIVSATGTANSGTTIGVYHVWAGCIATFKASGAPPPAGGVLAQVI